MTGLVICTNKQCPFKECRRKTIKPGSSRVQDFEHFEYVPKTHPVQCDNRVDPE